MVLTGAEARLVDVLSANPDRVFSRKELLATCFPSGTSEATVDSYVHYIRRKASPELLETARSRGYRIGGGDA